MRIGADTYDILDGDRSHYANYSGTGNTLNTNHPIVRRMILMILAELVDRSHVRVERRFRRKEGRSSSF